MDENEVLALIIKKSGQAEMADWSDVINDYAECVAMVANRLSESELERLIFLGGTMYRLGLQDYLENGEHPSPRLQ